MKTIATANAVIFVIVLGIATLVGLNPKKWQTWLLSLYGCLSFFFVGMVGTGNFYESLTNSVFATFVLIFTGIITYQNRERAKKWLKEHGENKE